MQWGLAFGIILSTNLVMDGLGKEMGVILTDPEEQSYLEMCRTRIKEGVDEDNGGSHTIQFETVTKQADENGIWYHCYYHARRPDAALSEICDAVLHFGTTGLVTKFNKTPCPTNENK